MLIVEENGAMRRLVRAVLEGLRISISECSDGAQILAACAGTQPDWVVLDLNLSGVDAFGAIRQIAVAYPHIRILVLGDDDDIRLRHTATRAGAWSYVHKADLTGVRRLLDSTPQDPNRSQE